MAESSKKLNQALLSLGANIKPELNLSAAVKALTQFGRVVRVSSAWESLPFGPSGQPTFLNAAVWLETPLCALELKEQAIAKVETALGRVRSGNRFAPRPIDIDIIFFNGDILHLGQHHIPDEEALGHPFVAIPLAEIAPDYTHPKTGDTLAAIAARFDPKKSGMFQRNDVRLFCDGHPRPERSVYPGDTHCHYERRKN